MENINIKEFKGAYIIPAVNFDAETGLCEISGESFLEETAKFYTPLLDWIKRYTFELHRPITLNIKLTYFNTSTSKWLLNIFNVLKSYELNGGKVEVNWFYFEDDIDMIEDIEDYISDTGLKINTIAISE